MSELSSSSISIEAPLSEVLAVLTDIAAYPTWSSSIKSVEVLTKDETGRTSTAKLAIDAGPLKDRVTLEYDWSGAPARISFSMVDADLLTAMEGAYIVSTVDEDTTQVTYELHVDVSMPIPSIMRKNAEKATIETALKQLKTHLEA
ncbi:MAG: SRPBCC family protein [Actinobacteria bacterium]|nr:SRPBCC family protein [Actinomycetota bacterium]